MTSTPADRLKAAATHLRALLDAIATESPVDLPLHADGRTIVQGRVGLHPFATAETSEVATFIATLGPVAGEAIVGVLRSAAHDERFIGADAAALALADAILAGADR